MMRIMNVPFDCCDYVLSALNLLTAGRCNTWVNTIRDENDLCVILRKQRGSYKRVSFYEAFPELEKEAEAYAISGATQKNCSFYVDDLSKLIDQRFRELYFAKFGEEFDDDKLVRSAENCRVVLLRWGAR